MHSRSFSLFAVVAALALACASAFADDRSNDRSSVTVSFGAGLNTAQPGNVVNHQILPRKIRIKKGGVVNFIVGGFHQIMVYNPGRKAADIVVPPPGPDFFINDRTGLYYEGISPAGAPPDGISNALNRAESVHFADPGRYLVICNVRPHFLDGMWTEIRVDD